MAIFNFIKILSAVTLKCTPTFVNYDDQYIALNWPLKTMFFVWTKSEIKGKSEKQLSEAKNNTSMDSKCIRKLLLLFHQV